MRGPIASLAEFWFELCGPRTMRSRMVAPRESRFESLKMMAHVALGLMMICLSGIVVSVFYEYSDRRPITASWGLIAGGIGSAAMGVGLIWFAAGLGPYRLRVRDEGLEVERGRKTMLHPWTSIRAVRENAFGQRIEINVEGVRAPIRIHFQTSGFDELLPLLLERIPWIRSGSSEVPVVVSGRRSRELFYLVGGVVGVTWFAVAVEGVGMALGFVLAVLTIALARLRRFGISTLALDAGGLEAQTVAGTRRLSWHEVRRVYLAVRAGQHRMLELCVELEDGDTIRPSPGGIDLFVVYRALRSAGPARLFLPAT